MKLWQLALIVASTYVAEHTPVAWAAVFTIVWLIIAVVAAWKSV